MAKRVSRSVLARAVVPVLAAVALGTGAPVRAEGDNTGPDDFRADINGRVPPLCRLGTVATTDGEFAMGTLTAPTTAFLRRGLAAPDKMLTDSWCNAPSTLEISAIELTPQGRIPQLRDGFGRSVHFTATASGWSDEPAVFQTDLPAGQSEAVRLATRPRVVDLRIGVSNFRMPGGLTQRPVASRSYLGAVIVKLSPVL